MAPDWFVDGHSTTKNINADTNADQDGKIRGSLICTLAVTEWVAISRCFDHLNMTCSNYSKAEKTWIKVDFREYREFRVLGLPEPDNQSG